MLTSSDLFSGIGGMSVALKGVCRPLLYCEIDPFCRSVLETNMARGVLPTAPIWPDITTLRYESKAAPDVLTASFPCQDASQLGTRLGLQGERTGLVSHVVRLTAQIDC